VIIDSRSHSFELFTTFEVDSVLLDPRRRILCEKQGTVTTNIADLQSKPLVRLIGAVPNQVGNIMFISAPVGSVVSVRDVHGRLFAEYVTTDILTPLELGDSESGVRFTTVTYENDVTHFSIPVIR
jgi:hypothetical protein